MKKIIIIIFITILTNILHAQWSVGPTLSNLGDNPSVSAVSTTVAWVAGNTTTPVIYRTTNGGLNWTSIPTNGIPANVGIYCIWGVNANTAYAGDGTGNASVYKTTNAGVNWSVIFSTGGTTGFFNGIVFSRGNPNIGIAQSDPPNGSGNDFYLQITTNNGAIWNLFNPAPPGSSGNFASQHSPFIIDNLFFGFGMNAGGIVEITGNGGTNWITSYVGRNGFVSGLTFNNDKTKGIAAVSNSGLSRTTNSGLNWTTISVPGINGAFLSYCYWIPGTDVVYVSASGAGVYRSINGGLNWSQMTTGGVTDIRHMDYYVFNGIIYGYLIGGNGQTLMLIDLLSALPVEMTYFRYTTSNNNVTLEWETSLEVNNSGFNVERALLNSSWEKIGFIQGNGNQSTSIKYKYEDKNLQKGNYQYRLKQIDYNGNYEYFTLNSSVLIKGPDNYNLFQNYPNPFNPITKINFNLPFESNVKIKVYDIKGSEVAVIIDDKMTEGYHSVTFDATNLSTGIYYYNISATADNRSFNKTMKMTLIK
jgi:photosystem II stability/assembly factor-like uncharacterized protein